MKKEITTLTLLFASLMAGATDYFISPTGSDNNTGTTKATPFASLSKVQQLVKAGDNVFILPGTYNVTEAEIMDRTSSTVWDIVYDFAVNGTESKHICYKGIQDNNGKRPVFNLSAVNTGKRITAFYVRGKYLDFSGFEVIGLNVPKSSANTQSENFRINGGSHCTFEYIAAHDGMGIGFYLTGRSDYNVLTNCDAYNNFDSVNISVNNGGNSDGFGCHVAAGYNGNKFVYCRAWQNSDDGFDFINCQSPATAEYCIAYRNGYDKDGNKRADGNGFKAGGYGMGKAVSIADVPMHVVSHCLSVANKANGFYSNHHLGGIKFEYNSAYKNSGYDYSMICRRGQTLDDAVDVDGYGHILKNNVAFGSTKIIYGIDVEKCDIDGNSFSFSNGVWTNEEFSVSDFVSLSQKELTAERKSNGSLPDIYFMQFKDSSKQYGYGTFNSSPTGITTINESSSKRSDLYVSINGLSTTKPLPGHLYIHNGKKVVVR